MDAKNELYKWISLPRTMWNRFMYVYDRLGWTLAVKTGSGTRKQVMEYLEEENVPAALLDATYRHVRSVPKGRAEIQDLAAKLAAHLNTPVEWKKCLLEDPVVGMLWASMKAVTPDEAVMILEARPYCVRTLRGLLDKPNLLSVEALRARLLESRPWEDSGITTQVMCRLMEQTDPSEWPFIAESALDVWARRSFGRVRQVIKEAQMTRDMYRALSKHLSEPDRTRLLMVLIRLDLAVFWRMCRGWKGSQIEKLPKEILALLLASPEKDIRVGVLAKLADGQAQRKRVAALRAAAEERRAEQKNQEQRG